MPAMVPPPEFAAAGGRLTVDLVALVANWKALADHVAGGVHATAAVVKGDGYGIGLEQAATRAGGAPAARPSSSLCPTKG